jgi:signal transduction histidine kinase
MGTDEGQFRRDILTTLFKWALGITLTMGLTYLLAFWQRPGSATLILGIAFILVPFVAWWCLYRLRQGYVHQAIYTFIALGTIEITLFTLFMPNNLILIGMMGVFFLVRFTTFLETSKAIFFLGCLWATVYLVASALRHLLGLPPADLGRLGNAFEYFLPIAILAVFILLDRTVTRYLREALFASEAARRDLVRSYTLLKQQKQALEKSEADLSALATELEQSNRGLQATNQELHSFVYAVSHDIRAPLRVIHNYADFLHEDLAETLSGEQKKYLNNLVRAVHEGEQLVENLLILSGVGYGDAPFRTIDLGQFLKELATSLDLPPDVEIEWADNWPTLNVEPNMLQQIFRNLILNGVKFNHSSPKRIQLGWQPNGQEGYLLFVRDNGIGIDQRYHEKIFGVFQRLHNSKEFEGTGIGLALVKKAADKLQGSVWVESSHGVGSTFYITLPKTE